MRVIAILLPAFLAGCGAQSESPSVSPSSHYEAHCKEPLPVFTLGEKSNPTKAQEAALCACIWENLGSWERQTAEQLSQGKESEVSALNMRAFPARFGGVIEKCGGMKL